MTGRHARPPAGGRTGSPDHDHPDSGEEDGAEERQTILQQMGGVSGMIYSTVPVVVFVLVNALASLGPALTVSIGVAVAIAVFRLVRREPLQPAVSGLFGVAIGAFIAHRTGQARDFFLLGIWYSGVLAVLFGLSTLIRWPLAGVIWHGINGDGQGWRDDRALRRAYTLATLLWSGMFAVKFVAQRWLYEANQPGWLAVAKIAGYALTGIALLGTLWAVRRARHSDAVEQPVTP